MSESASPGAIFLAVRYEITNDGKETATVLADDFELVDSHGRKYRASSKATTAFIMAGGDKDLALTELQPGVTKASVQLFEVPAEDSHVGTDGTKLRVPEKGIGGSGEAVVILATRSGATKVRF